jgi:3-dehydroquinate synthase
MRRLRVTSRDFDYYVVVGRGAWREMRRLPDYSSRFVLTERHLWKRWGEYFVQESGLADNVPLFVPSGERSKSLEFVEVLAQQLLERGADRRSLLIALGGGVVGDLGGFVASTYMRGIDCVQVPTTVVAQVDSAIGGKTAVNVGAMKNLLGTFYPPRLVLADPDVLASLGKRAFRSGLYEVVKHAILDGPEFFAQLEKYLPRLRPVSVSRRITGLRPGQRRELEAIIERAARVKVDVVCRDEREAGLRRVLNLGHTFGHALEEATAYRRFLHGEAVAWGLLAVTRLAELLGRLSPGQAERIARLVRRVGPLPPPRQISAETILKLLPRDKKAVGGKIHWVIPERIGKVRIVNDIPLATAARAWRDVCQGGWHE